jgi:DHA2 family multidrug resistance protein
VIDTKIRGSPTPNNMRERAKNQKPRSPYMLVRSYMDSAAMIAPAAITAHGSSLVQAHQQAIDWIGQQVQAQASFLAYMDAFWVLMLISLAAVPLTLSLRKVKLGGPVHVGH